MIDHIGVVVLVMCTAARRLWHLWHGPARCIVPTSSV
jgi:hypothetical protein